MRETGPIRKRFDGDTESAKDYIGLGRTVLGDLKQRMTAGGLQQLSRQITLSDGTVIRAQSVYGQDTVSVETGVATPAGAKAAEIVAAENDQFIKYYYSSTVAAPCPSRSLGIIASQTGGGAALGALVLLSDNTVLATTPNGGDGVNDFATITVWSGDGWIQLFSVVFVNGGSEDYSYFVLGQRINFIVPADVLLPGGSDTPPVFPQPTRLPHQSANTTPTDLGGGSFLYTTDYTYFNAHNDPVGAETFGTLTVIINAASGSGHTLLRTYTYNGSDYGTGEQVPNTPRIAGVTWQLFTGVKSVYADGVIETGSWSAVNPSYESVFETDFPGLAAQIVQFDADWTAARLVAYVRERARVRACSDSVKNSLKLGALLDQIKTGMRSGQPLSAGTYQAALMTVVVVNSSTGFGDDVTNTKTVTLSYQSTDADGNSTTLQQIITGTQHIAVTRITPTTPSLTAVYFATTTTYVDWLPVSSTGDTGVARDYTFLIDNAAQLRGLMQMWNGVTYVEGATFIPVLGLSVPLFPQVTDSRTYSYPQLYIDYRAITKRLYKVGSGSTAWLDSAFLQDGMIDIFPLSTIHLDLGDLGMFPQATDTANATKLALQANIKATYSYDYKTGLWTGIGSDLVDGNGNPAPVTLLWQGLNCVFRSRTKLKEEWPDVAAVYQGQMADMKQNPGSYPFFVPLDSL